MNQTIDEIYGKLVPFVGVEMELPATKNKGLVGLMAEKILGIPPTPNCLDCVDGELKTFPLKRLKNGQLVPKETIAVTMLAPEQLKEHEFQASRCYKKMSRMLIVPYLRTGDIVQFMTPQIICREDAKYAELYAIMEADYTQIREEYLATGVIQSKTGKLLQSRTKGTGHGSTSRAFYLRPEFMKRCLDSLR
jgi:DNA mismatch repair protein MutH